jgi:hypothetical protein
VVLDDFEDTRAAKTLENLRGIVLLAMLSEIDRGPLATKN